MYNCVLIIIGMWSEFFDIGIDISHAYLYIYTVNEHCEWASYLLMRMNHQVSIRVYPYVHNSWHAKRNRSATASWAQTHLGMLYTTYIFMVIWGMVYYCFTHIIRYAGIFGTKCTLQGWTKNKNTVSNHQLATETQFRKKMKEVSLLWLSLSNMPHNMCPSHWQEALQQNVRNHQTCCTSVNLETLRGPFLQGNHQAVELQSPTALTLGSLVSRLHQSQQHMFIQIHNIHIRESNLI